MIVVDDHVLFAVLAGRANEALTPVAGEDVYTTGGWYYRLARAIRDSEFTGALSRRMSGLSPEGQHAVTMSLHQLPPEIGVLSPRTTVPVMAALSSIGRFNLLQAEALATALVLHAGLRVTVASENLRAACVRPPPRPDRGGHLIVSTRPEGHGPRATPIRDFVRPGEVRGDWRRT